MGAAATTLHRAVGDVFDATITHDHSDILILEAPVREAALPELLRIAKSGGPIAAVPEDYEAPPGFPRLALVFQTYSSNNFFTGENSERNLQLMASRREQYESTRKLGADAVEGKTRSKGILGRLLDGSAAVLTSDLVMGDSESAQLRLYLGPDEGTVVLESCIDDLLYKLIADLIFFNKFLHIFNADSDMKVRKRADGVDYGIEFGGTFGLFEKTGDFLHLDVSRTNPKPLDAPLVPRPPPSPRLRETRNRVDDADFAIRRRLLNPRWRFVGLPDSADRARAPAVPPPGEKRPRGDALDHLEIVGFTLVETMGSAPVTKIDKGDGLRWAWSGKLLDGASVDGGVTPGTIAWDNDGASPLQDMVNRFRESTDHADVAVFYCPHSKLAYNQIAASSEIAHLPNYAKWLARVGARAAPAPEPEPPAPSS